MFDDDCLNNKIIVKKNVFFNYAIKKLTKIEKRLIALLINQNLLKEDIIAFLDIYDIENEKASNTYLLNYLIEKFDISEIENKKIPRIRGLKEYYRFHNINVMQAFDNNTIVFDADIYLRIIYKDDIRPFTFKNTFINENFFRYFFGEKYIDKYLSTLKKVNYNNKFLLLPDEKYLTDLIYLKIYLSIIYGINNFSFVRYVYDVFCYTKDMEISRTLRNSIIRKFARHLCGEIKRRIA